jgi:hypothetical protein
MGVSITCHNNIHTIVQHFHEAPLPDIQAKGVATHPPACATAAADLIAFCAANDPHDSQCFGSLGKE